MPRRRSEKAVEYEVKMAKAIEAVISGDVKSAYAAEKKYGVDRKAIARRIKGSDSRATANERKQLLSAAEEDALFLWCRRLTAGGYPAHHQVVKEMAHEILTRRVASINIDGMYLVNIPPIGKDWTKRFLLRYPTLKSTMSRKIDASRWKDTTPEVINAWFDAYADAYCKHNFAPHNIYNMDETGFGIGTSQSCRVIIDSTLRTRYKMEPGRQEWVSVVECISADGNSLPPLVIFKAENISNTWITESTPHDWQFSASSKGWTSNVHGLEWVRRVFEPATREKANGQPRLLICDGHDSHISGNFIGHCMDYNIVLLVLPPHTSHLTQPLDVCVFGPLSIAHGREVDRFQSLGVTRISKSEWLDIYLRAREKAFTEKNILSAWKNAGLTPLVRWKVLKHVPSHIPTSPLSTPLTSSPPDAVRLLQTNRQLRSILARHEPLNTPMREHVVRLTNHSERLAAQVSILRHQSNLQSDVLGARKKRNSAKRLAIKDQFMVTTKDILDAVKAAELETAKRVDARRGKKRKRPATPSDTEGEDQGQEEESEVENEVDLTSEVENCEIGDTIVCRFS
jgi:hypothetical protein